MDKRDKTNRNSTFMLTIFFIVINCVCVCVCVRV